MQSPKRARPSASATSPISQRTALSLDEGHEPRNRAPYLARRRRRRTWAARVAGTSGPGTRLPASLRLVAGHTCFACVGLATRLSLGGEPHLRSIPRHFTADPRLLTPRQPPGS